MLESWNKMTTIIYNNKKYPSTFAKLSQAPAPPGLRLPLFQHNPATHPPTTRIVGLNLQRQLFQLQLAKLEFAKLGTGHPQLVFSFWDSEKVKYLEITNRANKN